MVVRTETEPLQQSRRGVLSLLLAKLPRLRSSQSRLELKQNLNTGFGISGSLSQKGKAFRSRYIVDNDPNPFIHVDFNKCILCTRCVRACAEIQGRFVWGVGGRGSNTRIIAGADTTMLEARCESCGACAVYCPTGALDHKLSFQEGKPDRKVTTTCAFCGVGCQFDLNVKRRKSD